MGSGLIPIQCRFLLSPLERTSVTFDFVNGKAYALFRISGKGFRQVWALAIENAWIGVLQIALMLGSKDISLMNT